MSKAPDHARLAALQADVARRRPSISRTSVAACPAACDADVGNLKPPYLQTAAIASGLPPVNTRSLSKSDVDKSHNQQQR